MRPSLSVLRTTARDIWHQAKTSPLCWVKKLLYSLTSTGIWYIDSVTIGIMWHVTLLCLLPLSNSSLGTMLLGFDAFWLGTKRSGDRGLCITLTWNGDCTWFCESPLFGSTQLCPTSSLSGRLSLKSRVIWQNNFSSLALFLCYSVSEVRLILSFLLHPVICSNQWCECLKLE